MKTPIPQVDVEQRIAQLFAKDAIVVKVGEKEHKYSVAGIYDSQPDMAAQIKKGLLKVCNSGSTDEDKERHLQNALRIFQEGAIAKVHYDNVLREELRIRNQELNPHKFDLRGFYRQVGEQLQKHNARGQAYRPSLDGFPKNDAPVRMSGATEAEIQAIKEGQNDGSFVDNPNKFYRNNVFDSEVSARDDIRVNNQRLKNFLKNGSVELTPSEEKACRKHTRERHELSNKLQAIGALTLEGTKKIGRGVISKTDASETPDYKRYGDKRNDSLYDMLYRACPRKDRASYFRLLKDRNMAMINGGDYMSAAMAMDMNNILDAMITQAEEEDKKYYDELQRDIESGNKSTITGLQKHIDKEDEAHKWTLMCAFIMLGPFATGIALGPVIGHLIGPVLTGSGTFAQNLAALPTNSLFGPFGQFAKLCHVPDLIQFSLDHVPVINQFSEIMDFATRNPISAGVLDMGMPLLGSPLTALGMAGLAATYAMSSNYLNYTDKRDFTDSREKALENLKKDFLAKGNAKQEERVENYARQIVESHKKSYVIGKLAEFLSETDEAALEKLKMKFDPEKQKEFSDMKKNGSESPRKMMELLKGIDGANPLIRNFLMYEGVGRDLEKFKELSSANTVEQNKVISDRAQKFGKDFILDWAGSFNIKGFATNSEDENCKYFESQMMEIERNHLREVELVAGLEDLEFPKSSPKPVKASQLGPVKSAGKGSQWAS